MDEFWFYIQLGFNHVMDPGAYDHILFLTALALPFSFTSWKKVVVLATVFTVAHCTSLALSAYGLIRVDIYWIEVLIPVTIILTAVFDLFYTQKSADEVGLSLHLLSTAFFGLIHGFGFSNYFNMLMADSDRKAIPLLGFAAGIEIAQVIIIFAVLILSLLLQDLVRIKRRVFITSGAIIIALITIPLLIAALEG